MTTTEARPLTSRFFGTRVAGPVSLLSSIPLDGLSETQGERGARAPTKLFRCLRCVWTSLADVLRASRHELDLGGAACETSHEFRELENAHLVGSADVVDLAGSSALHRGDDPARRVADEAEAPCLRAVPLDRDRASGDRRSDERRGHA